MPCRYTIYKNRRLVVTIGWDPFTFAEGLAHEDQISLDPDFDPTYDHLIDATLVTRAALTGSELASLASRTKFSRQSRRAIIVTSTVLFGLGRMFETYLQLSGSAESMGIFKERDQALQWLGIEGKLESA
jgi:hypothetical protein